VEERSTGGVGGWKTVKGYGLEREGEKKRSAWISRAFMTVIGLASQPSQLEAE
jgi:hypothetical protein